MILKKIYKSNLNIFSTLLLNFRAFRFRDAIKLPVFCYGNINFEGVHKGCIELSEVHFHTLRLGGGRYTYIFGNSNLDKSYYRFSGTLSVGSNVIIDQGCIISICSGARLALGDNVYINRRSTIHVKESILVEHNTWIGWNCQILDSDFHFMVNDDGIIGNRNRPVRIGHCVWLANNVYVSKGAVLPDYSVVASMSLVNKDLSSFGEKCLFGGIPVRCLKTGIRRLFLAENDIDQMFKGCIDSINIDSIPFIKEL